MECIFCNIANKKTESYVIYEDPIVIAVLDINPASPGNTLVFTKKHYSTLYEIPQEEYLHLLSIARALGFAIKNALNATDVDIIYSKEINKGSIIPHAIITLLPRYENDNNSYLFKREQGQNLEEIRKLIIAKLDEIKGYSKETKSEEKVQEQKEEKPKIIEIKRKTPIV